MNYDCEHFIFTYCNKNKIDFSITTVMPIGILFKFKKDERCFSFYIKWYEVYYKYFKKKKRYFDTALKYLKENF